MANGLARASTRLRADHHIQTTKNAKPKHTCHVRKQRSGCGMTARCRPSSEHRPAMPSGDPLGLNGYASVGWLRSSTNLPIRKKMQVVGASNKNAVDRGEGGRLPIILKGRWLKIIDPHVPTMTGRSTSRFHSPGKGKRGRGRGEVNLIPTMCTERGWLCSEPGVYMVSQKKSKLLHPSTNLSDSNYRYGCRQQEGGSNIGGAG